MTRGALGILALAAVLAAAPGAPRAARAQTVEYRPEQVGAWRYRSVAALAEPRLSAEERRTVLAQLRALGDVVATMPLMRPPRGVEVEASERLDLGCGHEPRLCRQAPVPAWTEIAVMGYQVMPDGKVAPGRIEPPGLTIGVNDPTLALHDHGYDFERLYDAEGREIVYGLAELTRVGEGGETVVWDNNVVVLAKRGRPLTVPVSREAYLRALLKRNAGERAVTDLLAAELAALSPAERRLPAYVGGAETISRLVPADAEGAMPLVIFNPDYFDPALPRTAVQLVAIRFMYGNRFAEETPAPPDYAPDAIRVYEIRQRLDYARMARLVR